MDETGIEKPVLATVGNSQAHWFRTLRIWLWAAWIIALGLWSVALLTPGPAEFSHEHLSQPTGYVLAKSLHVSVYAGFAATALLLGMGSGRRWLPVCVLSVHGFLTEYLQTFVPLRTGCWQDVVIDHVGILLGVLVCWGVGRHLPGTFQGVKD